MSDIIGIDLGTTKSAVAVWENGTPKIIPNVEGERITPSVVAWNEATSEWLVGRQALKFAAQDPHNAIYSIKRLMGRHYSEEAVQKHLDKHILYEVVEAHQRPDGIEVVIGQQHLMPQEVSAMILKKLKADAEEYLNRPVKKAVITVPAYFHDSQRQATRDAGRLAGLEVMKVLNEPTSACLAFGYTRLSEERRIVAVYDLGGGTFDISIMEVGRGPFTVLSINGNTFLGGSDIDWYLVNWILDQLGNKKHLREDDNVIAQLRAIAEQAKHQLSDNEITTISIPVELCPAGDGKSLELPITRSELQDIVKPFVADTILCCKQAMADAKLSSPDEIKEVLMVGGQTRMPAIRKTTQEFFGIEPNISLPPEEVVALGAAVQAAIFAGEVKGMKLYDVVPLSLGVKIQGGVMDTLIPRNTSLPFSLTRSYSARKGQSGVDIEVYQGEDPDISRNVHLGGFSFENLEMSRDGAPDIQVTFRIDEFGILQVTAKDMLQMGKEESITITDSVRLSDAEIEQIVQSAEAHRVEYAARRKLLTLQAEVHSLHEQLMLRFNERKKTLSVELSDAIRAKLDEYPPKDWDEYLKVVKELYKQVS